MRIKRVLRVALGILLLIDVGVVILGLGTVGTDHSLPIWFTTPAIIVLFLQAFITGIYLIIRE